MKNAHLDRKIILYNCPLPSKERKSISFLFSLHRFSVHTIVPSGLSGGCNLSNKPEPAAWGSAAFWAGVSGRETKHFSLWLGRLVHWSSAHSQINLPGRGLHHTHQQLGACVKTSQPLQVGKAVLIGSWATLMGERGPHHPPGSALGPFQPEPPRYS